MPSSEAALRPPTQKHVYVGRPQGSSKITTRPRPLSRAPTSGLTRLQTPVPFPPRGFRLKTRTHTYNKRGLRCGQDLAPAAACGPHDVRRRLQQRGSQVLERFRVRRGEKARVFVVDAEPESDPPKGSDGERRPERSGTVDQRAKPLFRLVQEYVDAGGSSTSRTARAGSAGSAERVLLLRLVCAAKGALYCVLAASSRSSRW